MAEQGIRQKAHRASSVLSDEGRDTGGGKRPGVRTDNGDSAGANGIGDEAVAVRFLSAPGNEERAGRRLSRVVYDTRYIRVRMGRRERAKQAGGQSGL
jgi:hypothetical protein